MYPNDFYRLIIQNREYIADSAITPLRKISLSKSFDGFSRVAI
jgi:hypothetical protein